MLKGNLSSRPFYNERLVSLVLGLAAAAVLALTAVSGYQLWTLSRERSALAARAASHRAEADRVRREAVTLTGSVDPGVLEALVRDSREANLHLDERAFSWTNFFGFIERTLPADARLVAVTPDPGEGTFELSMLLVAREPEDMDAFVQELLDTGRFYDVFPENMTRNDDGSFNATLTATYLPQLAKPAAADAHEAAGRMP
jgi:hypothetical protein